MLPTRNVCALALCVGWLYPLCASADPGPNSDTGVTIALHGDRLTARIERASLGHVLSERRRQTGVESQFLGPADDDTVSESFNDVPFVEAISRLLNGRSFMIYYEAAPVAGATAHAPSLQLVIVPRAGAAAPESRAVTVSQPTAPRPIIADPAPADAPAPTGSEYAASALDEFTQAMVDPDESVRARAQKMFEQALGIRYQSAASVPQQRR